MGTPLGPKYLLCIQMDRLTNRSNQKTVRLENTKWPQKNTGMSQSSPDHMECFFFSSHLVSNFSPKLIKQEH